jgi:predicted Zn-dependent protease with MMP-like domain
LSTPKKKETMSSQRGPNPLGSIKIDAEAFERLVEQAVSRIPKELRVHLANVVIMVEPRPSRELLAELGIDPEEMLFGLYMGVPLDERSAFDPPLLPDTIHIYQEPLESCCSSREELSREIELTVVHEVAHYFGFNEEQLEQLGYG